MLGVRLPRFRASFDWQRLTVPEALLKDWTDYLSRGLSPSPIADYRAMDAASFPYWCSELLGIERVSLLKKVTALTMVDETPEQAMALQLPLAEDGTTPVTEMTVCELETAYAMMREATAKAERSEEGEQPNPNISVDSGWPPGVRCPALGAAFAGRPPVGCRPHPSSLEVARRRPNGYRPPTSMGKDMPWDCSTPSGAHFAPILNSSSSATSRATRSSTRWWGSSSSTGTWPKRRSRSSSVSSRSCRGAGRTTSASGNGS
jgi:hypothetical protein